LSARLQSLLNARNSGCSLPGGLYREPDIYETEIRAIFMKSWLCVGHQSQIDCEIIWLVNGSAVEGRDYDHAQLTWLWDVTTRADKEIIERNQAGVDSRFYEPGPLSSMEEFTSRFLEWYVATMRATDGGVTDDRPVTEQRS
jgi:phenylpropionate dioxygenase-like ring-hydroxylating dioxygenase large terminal subunit